MMQRDKSGYILFKSYYINIFNVNFVIMFGFVIASIIVSYLIWLKKAVSLVDLGAIKDYIIMLYYQCKSQFPSLEGFI